MSIPEATTEYMYYVRAVFGTPELEDEWNAWYSGTHIEEMLSVPGIRSATRYREIGVDARYVTIYEIESPDVLSSPEYLAIAGWGERWRPHITRYHRGVVKRTAPEESYLGPAATHLPARGATDGH